jgi:hypothetical protein
MGTTSKALSSITKHIELYTATHEYCIKKIKFSVDDEHRAKQMSKSLKKIIDGLHELKLLFEKE